MVQVDHSPAEGLISKNIWGAHIGLDDLKREVEVTQSFLGREEVGG